MMNNFSVCKAVHVRRCQSGAALVVALILLVALTLMAIASMNTASLDLIMAGNEQYASRAFAAAEAGVANAVLGGTFNSTTDFTQAATSAGLGHDTYSYIITRPTGGMVGPAPPGFSLGTNGFGTVPFRITSTGNSERGAVSTTVQEVLVVAPADTSTATCDPTLANCTTTASSGSTAGAGLDVASN